MKLKEIVFDIDGLTVSFVNLNYKKGGSD